MIGASHPQSRPPLLPHAPDKPDEESKEPYAGGNKPGILAEHEQFSVKSGEYKRKQKTVKYPSFYTLQHGALLTVKVKSGVHEHGLHIGMSRS